MPPPHNHLKGRQIDDLLVLSDLGNDSNDNVVWKCQCRCGAIVQRTSNALNMRKKTLCEHAHIPLEIPSKTDPERIQWKAPSSKEELNTIEDLIRFYVSSMDDEGKNEFLTKLILKEIGYKFL